MEKEKVETEIIKVCYKEHCRSEKEWIDNVNLSIVAVYALNCGKCGQPIRGEMEWDGKTLIRRFSNRYHNPQEKITYCPNHSECGVELDLNDPWLVVQEGGEPKLLDTPDEILWGRGIRLFLISDYFIRLPK